MFCRSCGRSRSAGSATAPNARTLAGAVQTSRGCPFQCEFCEVITFHGQKQRFKTIEQVIAELDQLHALGYNQVFISDDNLTANKKRAKTLLAAIAEWNRSNDRPTEFATQLSIEAAEDGEGLMATRFLAEVLARPHVARTVVAQVMAYLQLRYLLDRGGFWQPELAKLSGPRLSRRKPSIEAALELVDRSAA